jgi:tyrosine-protein phosphatase SIW14
MQNLFPSLKSASILLIAIIMWVLFSNFLINDLISSKLESANFKNLHKIDQNFYRSEQPSQKGMQELERLGISTVLNLRNVRNDNCEVRKTNLNLAHYPINTWKMNYHDIVNALKIIENSKKPVLVHCLHGSDRTGVIVAAYRMAVDGWSREEAIAEFKLAQFGYHEKWFPSILNLLIELDIEKLKKDIKE